MAKIDFKEEDMSTLKELIEPKESELKNYVVDYVGNKLSPENESVDIEMVINVFAEEFPELVLALAEAQQQHITLVHLRQLHIQLLLKLIKIQLLLLQQQEVHNCKKQIKVQQQYIQQHLIQVL